MRGLEFHVLGKDKSMCIALGMYNFGTDMTADRQAGGAAQRQQPRAAGVVRG